MDEECKKGNKKIKINTVSHVDNNSLHIFMDSAEHERFKDFGEKMYPWRGRLSEGTQTQSDSDNLSGKERAQSRHDDTPDLDETQQSADINVYSV